jgi:hypothetical protein
MLLCTVIVIIAGAAKVLLGQPGQAGLARVPQGFAVAQK